jgi:PAS domain S-box-containing protein
MLEAELFNLLEHTADAAYTVTTDGEICSWNRSAELLLGYSGEEVLGRNIDHVLKARDTMGTPALAGGREASTRSTDDLAGGVPNFDLEVEARGAERMWVNVSTIIFDNPRTGRRLFVRLMHGVNERHRNEVLLNRMVEAARQLVQLAESPAGHAPVSPLSDQERRILSLFAEGSDSAAISTELDISAQTLRNHLHHINRKLRTRSRLEAVTHARLRGLIDSRSLEALPRARKQARATRTCSPLLRQQLARASFRRAPSSASSNAASERSSLREPSLSQRHAALDLPELQAARRRASRPRRERVEWS